MTIRHADFAIETAKPVFNKADIMRDAWRIVHSEYEPSFLRMVGGPSKVFPNALRKAWFYAKRRAEWTLRGADSLRSEADMMRNRSRLSWQDMQYQNELVAFARVLEAQEAEAQAKRDMDDKARLIASAGGRFATVEFTKADGSRRVMKVQPAKLKYHVKGVAASEPAKRAAETRKARHPHLLPVWDAEAQGVRSVNLATVTRIAVNGTIHEFNAAA